MSILQVSISSPQLEQDPGHALNLACTMKWGQGTSLQGLSLFAVSRESAFPEGQGHCSRACIIRGHGLYRGGAITVPILGKGSCLLRGVGEKSDLRIVGECSNIL